MNRSVLTCSPSARIAALLLIGALVATVGCGPKKEVRKAPAPPAPAFTGPEFLYGTIGSLTSIRGYQPVLVSGYGTVLGLKNTGSDDAPPALRAQMINWLSRRGIGRVSEGLAAFGSPTRFLASDATAVVLVEGIIPPAAPVGTRFDIIVRALSGSTTSLADGKLWPEVELRRGGAMLGTPSGQILATAAGDVFINPFEQASDDPASTGLSDVRAGRVLGGGLVADTEPIALVLNRPSYMMAYQIANRINGAYPQHAEDKHPLAVAKSDQVIEINVLHRFRDNPRRMLELVSGLYVDGGDQFNQRKARELRDYLADPAHADRGAEIAVVWQAMGRSIRPFLRDHYDHAQPAVRMAALEAGARLGDLRTLEPLAELAAGREFGRSEQAAMLLGRLLEAHPQHLRVAESLRRLLDHSDVLVRTTAFDGLAAAPDNPVSRSVIRRVWFPGRFELALVESAMPMIYVTRTGVPRLLIFDQMLRFERPMLFSAEGMELMLRLNEADDRLAVRYRDPREERGEVYEVAPSVGNLVRLLAGRDEAENDSTPGLAMSYSQVVQVLYQLREAGYIDAPIVLQSTELSERIRQFRDRQSPEGRPETEPDAPAPESSENPQTAVAPRGQSGDNRGR
jgi:hypothetical protein